MDPRALRMGSGEVSTLRKFIVGTIHLIVRVIKSLRLRWADYVAKMEEGRSAFKIVTGTAAEKRPLGRLRRRWKDNIRMDLKEIGVNTRNWVDSAQNRDY